MARRQLPGMEPGLRSEKTLCHDDTHLFPRATVQVCCFQLFRAALNTPQTYNLPEEI